MKYTYKSVKFTPKKWQAIKLLANELSRERGATVPLQQAILEAVKSYREQRSKGQNDKETV